jgi:hypothetical protein
MIFSITWFWFTCASASIFNISILELYNVQCKKSTMLASLLLWKCMKCKNNCVFQVETFELIHPYFLANEKLTTMKTLYG